MLESVTHAFTRCRDSRATAGVLQKIDKPLLHYSATITLPLYNLPDKSTTQRARDPHHFPKSQLPLINTVFDREHKAVQA